MSSVQGWDKLDSDSQSLVEQALAVRARAYAPYSDYKVGTALQADDGAIYVGCNVENSSFGLSICSERSAICQMLAAGAKKIERLAVVTSSAEPPFPCGACLQVIGEFGIEAEIITANTDRLWRRARFSQIMPFAFVQGHLES